MPALIFIGIVLWLIFGDPGRNIAAWFWTDAAARSNGDPYINRGDFECGVGTPKNVYGLNVYRLTVR